MYCILKVCVLCHKEDGSYACVEGRWMSQTPLLIPVDITSTEETADTKEAVETEETKDAADTEVAAVTEVRVKDSLHFLLCKQ